MTQDIIHMITPGIDSVCAYFYILDHVPFNHLSLVHVPISPRYKLKETEALFKLGKRFKHKVEYLELGNFFVREEQDGFIPSRNLLLATLANASNIQSSSMPTYISFSFTADDRVYDSDGDFCRNVSKVLNGKTTMGSLVDHFSKLELADWFINQSTVYTKIERINIIKDTYSCYSSEQGECLECNACFRKSVILSGLNLEVRPIKEDFLKMRLNILNESVPTERKTNIKSYVKKLIDGRLISDGFSKLIETGA